MTYTTRTTCRVCGSADLTPLFSLGEQHVSDFVDRPNEHALRDKVPIDIELCRSCTLVQQKHTAPQDFLYTRHYWYRSGVTETMREALRDVAFAIERAVDGLRPGDVVLDIGSNDGTLLRSYTAPSVRENAEYGIWKVGVEPARNLQEEGKRGVDWLVNDFWGAHKPCADGTVMIGGRESGLRLPKRARAITALGMFYDLESPNAFIRDVARVLAPDGVFVAQLMCLKQTLERGDVGNFAHEHLEFYSLRSLITLFARHGLVITRVEENGVNGGSYRVFARHEKHAPDRPEWRDEWHSESLRNLVDNEIRLALDRPATYADFFARLEENKAKCVQFVRSAVAAGKKVWVYGASTKGNVIAQWLSLDSSLIGGAADRSPEKWGRYTVGTGIPIVSEEEFRKAAPDFAVVMPYSFREEFLERESAWRAGGGRFIFPLPTFEVV